MNVWAVNGERGRKRQTRRRGDKGGGQEERGKDERKKRAQQKQRKRRESREYEESHGRTETDEKGKTWRGGWGEGEELSVGSTSTDLFPQDVFSSVTKDGCRTCSPVFQIKTITPALCCRGFW